VGRTYLVCALLDEESAMSERRVITKYPNRRIYDTGAGRYITMVEIRQIVIEHIDFVVIERTTGRDITYLVLLQVLAEHPQPTALLSREFLVRAICAQKLGVPAHTGGTRTARRASSSARIRR
jgi:polyhydroxyalkanoate synthesis repressor PhaR